MINVRTVCKDCTHIRVCNLIDSHKRIIAEIEYEYQNCPIDINIECPEFHPKNETQYIQRQIGRAFGLSEKDISDVMDNDKKENDDE